MKKLVLTILVLSFFKSNLYADRPSNEKIVKWLEKNSNILNGKIYDKYSRWQFTKRMGEKNVYDEQKHFNFLLSNDECLLNISYTLYEHINGDEYSDKYGTRDLHNFQTTDTKKVINFEEHNTEITLEKENIEDNDCNNVMLMSENTSCKDIYEGAFIRFNNFKLYFPIDTNSKYPDKFLNAFQDMKKNCDKDGISDLY